MKLSRFFPRGYWVRSYLITILPIGLLLVAMTTLFISSHVREVNRRMSRSVAQEIEVLTSVYTQATINSFNEIRKSYEQYDLMTVSVIGADETLVDGHECCTALKEALERAANNFDITRLPESSLVRVIYKSDDLTLDRLMFTFQRKRTIMITAHIFIVWTLLFSILLLVLAHGFLRNHVRSILNLAAAADAFGRGDDAPDFKPSGAREVRQAARSVIRMRNRIKRYADQRTQMLAGVSHDLRTPLTRLKLELALIKNMDMSAAKADIAEMEGMLEGYLAFARGEDNETSEQIELSDLIRSACAAAEERATFDIDLPTNSTLRGRRLSLKRAISNLANNAADHADKVRVSVKETAETVEVIVEDDGPGIAEEHYNAALRPFGRLDSARNQNKSGVGLGLTITRDIARAHGGWLNLGRSNMGGLMARLTLPRSAEGK